MRTSIYTRFSSDRQREASLEDQERVCRAYADRRGWEVDPDLVFADRAITGSVTGRPGYQAMQAAAKARQFDVLIVDDLSRLARDQEESLRMAKRLAFWGLALVAVADGVDTASNPKSSRLVMGVKGAMNEEYLRDLGEKTFRGLEGRVRAGLSPGGQPYGYTTEPVYPEGTDPADPRAKPVGHRRVVVPEQAAIVRRIFELYAQGHSSRAIAEALNGDEIPPPGARWRNRQRVAALTWSQSAIQGSRPRGIGIINNESYLGKIVWNKFEWRRDPDSGDNGRRARRVALPRPENERVVAEVPELRIVSDELWAAVKAEQDRRSQGGPRSGRPPRDRTVYLLSGLLRCGLCGGHLAMRNRQGYGCMTRANRGKDLCANRSVANRLALEKAVLWAVREQLYSRQFIEDTVEHLRADYLEESRRAGDDEKVQEIQAAIFEAERGIERVTTAIARGDDEGRPEVTAELDETLNLLAKRKRRLQRTLETLDPEPRNKLAAVIPKLPDIVRDYVDDLSKLLEAGSVEPMKRGLEVLVEEIVVTPPNPPDRPHYAVKLKGALSRALTLVNDQGQIFVVAGVRSHRYLPAGPEVEVAVSSVRGRRSVGAPCLAAMP